MKVVRLHTRTNGTAEGVAELDALDKVLEEVEVDKGVKVDVTLKTIGKTVTTCEVWAPTRVATVAVVRPVVRDSETDGEGLEVDIWLVEAWLDVDDWA